MLQCIACVLSTVLYNTICFLGVGPPQNVHAPVDTLQHTATHCNTLHTYNAVSFHDASTAAKGAAARAAALCDAGRGTIEP